MRVLPLLTALSLLPLAAHAAPKKVELPGGAMDPWEGLVVKTWDCGESMIDARSKKGGVAACLRGLFLDPVSGRSTALVDVRVDHDDAIHPADLAWTLRLDSGRTERHLSGFQVAMEHYDGGPGAQAPVQPAALSMAKEGASAIQQLKPQERHQQHATLAWEFQTWDPSIPLKFINLKVKGGGVGGAFRWTFDEPLAHDGEWGARPAMVWDPEWAAEEPSCSMGRARGKDLDDLVDVLDDGAANLPLQMRFLVTGADDKSGMNIDFPDHKVKVEINGGKLVVLGRERFVIPIDESLFDGAGLPVELVYDGRFISVAIGPETYGPMDARLRDTGKFRWDVDFTDGKFELQQIGVTPCVMEPDDRWDLPAKAAKATKADPVAVQSSPAGAARRVGGGQAVVAVLEADGRVLAKAKQKKSALEVMAGALTVVQGVAAVGQAGAQFADDVNTNLDAMESGDVSKMKSSSTRVDVGPGGVTTTRSEATITPGADGSVGIDMQSETRSQASPNAMLGLNQPAGGGLPEARSAARVTTVEILGEAGTSLRIGKTVLGPFSGRRWVVQVRPGDHPVEVLSGGSVVATSALSAVAGGVARLRVTATGLQ